MTRQSADNLRKLNCHLVHLALEVEAKVNASRKNHNLELMLDKRNQYVKPVERT